MSKNKEVLENLKKVQAELSAEIASGKLETDELKNKLEALKRVNETIESYGKAKNASSEASQKWISIGLSALGIALPLVMTNKWFKGSMAAELDGKMPSFRTPNFLGSITRLFKK